MTIHEKTMRPVSEQMWKIENGQPYLLGSHCENCEEVIFPQKDFNFCPVCHLETLSTKKLSPKGKIVAATFIQKEPAGGFYKGPVPYMYGIVALNDGVKLYTLLKFKDRNDFSIGDEVELVIEPLYETDQEAVLTYKFKKVVHEEE